jgi:hypothetical protein
MALFMLSLAFSWHAVLLTQFCCCGFIWAILANRSYRPVSDGVDFRGSLVNSRSRLLNFNTGDWLLSTLLRITIYYPFNQTQSGLRFEKKRTPQGHWSGDSFIILCS